MTHVRQKIISQQQESIPDTSLKVMLGLGTSLSDVVQGIITSSNVLNFFQRGSQQINHVSVSFVINNQLLNLLITDDIESS